MAEVLIIDDDDDTRAVLRELLEEVGGHSVLEASDGIEGMQQLRESKRALVTILDHQMPNLNGIGVLQTLATEAIVARRHAYIFITAYRNVSVTDLPGNSEMAMATQILQKPFGITAVLEAVAKATLRLPT